MEKTVSIFITISCLILSSTDAYSDPDHNIEGLFHQARHKMIIKDLKSRGIDNPAVLKAMDRVKRHLFVDKNLQKSAYDDCPLPIEEGQTISQPFIVALMTQCLELHKQDNVLEIGTGSGYQAAVLSEITGHVYSIEINKKLSTRAAKLLNRLGYKNISTKTGDGFFGWRQHAPYDAIILTCSVEKIPEALVEQLREGGRILMPLGNRYQVQNLVIGTKEKGQLKMETLIPVRFVPMTGKADDFKEK